MPEWIVPAEDAGKKLITFLSERLTNHSARSIKRELESNLCLINGRTERFASYVIAKGDYINFKSNQQSLKQVKPKNEINLSRILYEDEFILAYNKPSRINSDESGILKLLKTYSSHLKLIHRLDRDTTGILLFAKNLNVFNKMVEKFQQLKVEKSYLAIVDGILEKSNGVIENHLGKKHTYEGQTIWGAVSSEKGLFAQTEWNLVKQGRQAALINCFPKTGRTHQIRVHFAEIGHPILGDFQYCKKFHCEYQPDRYLLHAYQISFEHPIIPSKYLDLKAPIPSDFIEAQKILFGISDLHR